MFPYGELKIESQNWKLRLKIENEKHKLRGKFEFSHSFPSF